MSHHPSEDENDGQEDSPEPEYLHTVERKVTTIVRDFVDVAAVDPGEAKARVDRRRRSGRNPQLVDIQVDYENPVPADPYLTGTSGTLEQEYREYLAGRALDMSQPVEMVLSYVEWVDTKLVDHLVEQAELYGMSPEQLHNDVVSVMHRRAEVYREKGLVEQLTQLYQTLGVQATLELMRLRAENPTAPPEQLIRGCPIVESAMTDMLCDDQGDETEDPDYDAALARRASNEKIHR